MIVFRTFKNNGTCLKDVQATWFVKVLRAKTITDYRSFHHCRVENISLENNESRVFKHRFKKGTNHFSILCSGICIIICNSFSIDCDGRIVEFACLKQGVHYCGNSTCTVEILSKVFTCGLQVYQHRYFKPNLLPVLYLQFYTDMPSNSIDMDRSISGTADS